ncbi:MAG: extracellular solute-binding protein [Planctomycetes bacterium]|nr:extracellular solute-binding protein [Planctomycetota bacterium]
MLRSTAVLVVALLALSPSTFAQDKGVVSVYCSLDRDFSEEILKLFEARTGIKVLPSFDIEQNKTVGLVNKIISEEPNPRCDVYWNNEVAQSVRLKSKGLLQPYFSANAVTIPAEFKDPEGYWTGLAARARVIIYNKDLIGSGARPGSIRDLADPAWAGRITMAKPLTGTTLTHAAALFALWGEEKTKSFYQDLLGNEIFWSQGNAMCMRDVGSGGFAWGYTDTDDANVALIKGMATDIIVPDQEEGGLGTLVIPNSVMIVKGAKNLDNARKLVDFILSREVEEKLAQGRSAQIPLHPGVPVPEGVLNLEKVKAMPVDWNKVGLMIERHLDWLKTNFENPSKKPGEESSRTWPWVVGTLVAIVFLVVLGRRSAV